MVKQICFLVFLAVVLFLAVAGCGQERATLEVQAIEMTPEADLQRQSEAQLVEQMALYRGRYTAALQSLIDFYDQQGNQLKAGWAKQELDHVNQGPQHSYLVVAELQGSQLKATESIEQADLLYGQGMYYYDQGKGVAGLLADQKKLYQAIESLDELIQVYPTSDKIDDAAFAIGEIYHYHLKDYYKALVYYQRVWQWDPNTPHAARYAMARVYDDFLHDKVQALNYYEQTIQKESVHADKTYYAARRIENIRQELGYVRP